MKQFEGIVVSTKMQKTIVVQVGRCKRHPLYKKIVEKTKKYKVDSGELNPKEGDKVTIKESKPISREKHWVVTNIITKGK